MRSDTGVLTIVGLHLGPDLQVTVDGQAVTVLPGATDTQVDVQAPASLLAVPGTYRLTVVDPIRRAWDGFVVSSPVVAPAALGAVSPEAGRREQRPPQCARAERPIGAPP